MKELGNLLKENEATSLVEAMLTGKGEASEKELSMLVGWAEQVRVDNLLLDMIIAGVVDVTAVGPVPGRNEPHVRLEKGRVTEYVKRVAEARE